METITAFSSCFGQTQRHRQRAAGRDAGEDALLPRQAAGHLLGVGLGDVLEAIHPGLVVDARQVGLGPLADAGDLRTVRRLAADDADAGFWPLR